jgi:hypothetical protein
MPSKYTVSYTENGVARTHTTNSAQRVALIATHATRSNRHVWVRDNTNNARVMSCDPHSTSARKKPGVMFEVGKKKFAECSLTPAFKKALKKRV